MTEEAAMLERGVVEAEGEADLVLACGPIAQGQEPDHERVGERELAAADGGENAEEGVFAGGGVDVDAVAHEPAENLRFGVHK